MTARVAALLAVAVAAVVAATAAETTTAETATEQTVTTETAAAVTATAETATAETATAQTATTESATVNGTSTVEGTAERVANAGAASLPTAGARTPAPVPTVSALPAVTGISTSAPPKRLLINKCCKRHEQLDQEQKLCVAIQNATQADRDNRDQEQESWGSVRRRGQPPWLTKIIWNILNKYSSNDLVVRYNWRPCTFNLTSVKWSKEAHFFRNGSIKVKLWNSVPAVKKQYLLLSPAEYCVDQAALGRGYMAYLTCPCTRVACVRKCCDHSRKLTLGQSVGMVQQAHCQARVNASFNVTLHEDEGGAGGAWRPRPANVSFELLRGPFRPSCAHGRKTIALDSSDMETAAIVVLANGSLSAKVLGSPFLPQEYCVDHTVSPQGEERLWALACARVAPPRPMTALDKVYVALYAVGMAALVATLAVYALLAELRRPVNAKALMCHAAALAVALLVLSVSRFVTQVQHYASCASLAFVAQFSLLAAFCWLSVLCFDIARAFSTSLRPVDSSAGAACRRLLLYSLFAWGGPAVIVAVSAYLNFAKGLSREVLRPDIGRQGCWFKKGSTVLAYYYGPVAFLLLANVAMFSFTMMRLRMAQRDVAHLKNEEGQMTGGALRRRRERLLLYAKLFSLMGVTWLLEVVAWAAGAGRITVFVVDSLNVLRGVGVFCACCCKREVLRSLRQRLSELLPCAPRPRMRERGMSYTVTTTLSVSTPISTRIRRFDNLPAR